MLCIPASRLSPTLFLSILFFLSLLFSFLLSPSISSLPLFLFSLPYPSFFLFLLCFIQYLLTIFLLFMGPCVKQWGHCVRVYGWIEKWILIKLSQIMVSSMKVKNREIRQQVPDTWYDLECWEHGPNFTLRSQRQVVFVNLLPFFSSLFHFWEINSPLVPTTGT